MSSAFSPASQPDAGYEGREDASSTSCVAATLTRFVQYATVDTASHRRTVSSFIPRLTVTNATCSWMLCWRPSMCTSGLACMSPPARAEHDSQGGVRRGGNRRSDHDGERTRAAQASALGTPREEEGVVRRRSGHLSGKPLKRGVIHRGLRRPTRHIRGEAAHRPMVGGHGSLQEHGVLL